MHRQPAPAAADLDQMIVRREPQAAADQIQFAPRRRLEGVPGVSPVRRRIHLVSRQEQREEVIAEIVVGRNVATAAGLGIAAQPVPAPQRPGAEPGHPRLHAVQYLAVAHQRAHQAHQVIARPMPGHVGFARADTAARSHRLVELRTPDLDAHRRLVVRRAELHAAAGILEHDASRPQLRQLAEDPLPQQPLEGREFHGLRHVQHHFVFSSGSGCECRGVPLSHSRSAFQ